MTIEVYITETGSREIRAGVLPPAEEAVVPVSVRVLTEDIRIRYADGRKMKGDPGDLLVCERGGEYRIVPKEKAKLLVLMIPHAKVSSMAHGDTPEAVASGPIIIDEPEERRPLFGKGSKKKPGRKPKNVEE